MLRPISALSWMLLAFATVAVTFAVTTWFLLSIAGSATPGTGRANARLDAVRTGLAAGTGAGAAVGLMLAFRRQHHQEMATALGDYDATERRITELYTKAADQLGSDKAAVRLAGLYALERLANSDSGHRQTIVHLICAYLRMPIDSHLLAETDPGSRAYYEDPAVPVVGNHLLEQELQVRITAQEILTRHLRNPDPARPDADFWGSVRLNLYGAFLINLDLVTCLPGPSTLRRATFLRFGRVQRGHVQGACFVQGRYVRAVKGMEGYAKHC
jgi:hypothetical protein